jgi:predicted RNA binding protein YcfA (HicA-like mRNA interferase family)
VTPRFPVDAPICDILRALQGLGFVIAREGNHLSPVRENADGWRTMMTIPNQRTLKSSTLRTILSQASISREDFLKQYHR